MSGKISPADNEANMSNPNHGTPGTNLQYDQVHGNRSKLLTQTASDSSQCLTASDVDEEQYMEHFGHELSEGDGI